jgi:hypothetical protein
VSQQIHVVAELHQLFRIAGQAGKFRENKRLDVPALHIGHHALGFGMLGDTFSADTGEVVDLHHLPAA